MVKPSPCAGASVTRQDAQPVRILKVGRNRLGPINRIARVELLEGEKRKQSSNVFPDGIEVVGRRSSPRGQLR
jgi:hypothetical protein